MARLYANENFPRPVVELLRAMGHDVVTVQEADERATRDEEVLDFANRNVRAVLTINRKHFIRLHKQSADHCGIIVCTYDPDFAGQAGRIADAISGEATLTGKLIRVNRPT